MVDLDQILVIDHEPQSRMALRLALQERGYVVHNIRTVRSVVECVSRGQIRLIILNASSLNFEVRRIYEIRSMSEAALIVLASCDSEEERIAALDAGADDCLGRSFVMTELLARVRAVFRRVQSSPAMSKRPEHLQLEDLQINFDTRHVISHGQPVHLTPTEFNLLHYLINNANVPIPHATLLQSVWGPEQGSQVEYLRVFINQLRKKIEADPAHPRYLLTERWIGYRFALPVLERTN